ncbi:LysM peptidoglycan-binding domain-containing protein [Actinoplanes regularis]|uniref:LysM domain-containing protein n=1 Tax=Actinoplanes regularis TaxID=52697 RepID=A0A238X770_9ACTN|nr:transglycosylase family protein [Actinoplanes regularis]GIE86501.1 transglycosylase [Actinoplanes regularis]SNR54560.1 LysM domain-containing protein [Actinoplanes regularis]
MLQLNKRVRRVLSRRAQSPRALSRPSPARRVRHTLAIAVAGLAGAVGLLTAEASPAGAATNVNWDAVAKCESGGNWRINTGNGYYGGLQFSRSTWRAHGGGKYGSTANLASKSQQIAIAERVLRSQGIRAWPTCGRRGLTNTRKSTSVTYRLASYDTSPKATRSYVVQPGDTLSGIARRYNVKGGWQALYRINASRLSNPNSLRVGQRLAL